ncbi:uncharacterized protein LOC144211006 [Stigmatopora nigra]
MISVKNTHHHHVPSKAKSKSEVSSNHGHCFQNVSRFYLLQERNRVLRQVDALRQKKQQYCKLRAKLQSALQEENRLNLQLISRHLKASNYDQIQFDFDQLKETLAVVGRERDVAQQQRSQLRGKVENLEQILKHMHETFEVKNQLQTEHEKDLAALFTKQKQSHQLQKVQICDLEQTCKSQSDHFHPLPKDLLNFSLHSCPSYIVLCNTTTKSSNLLLTEEQLPKVIVGFETLPKPGYERVPNTLPPLISQFLHCPQQTGDREKTGWPSVKSYNVEKDCASCAQQLTLSVSSCLDIFAPMFESPDFEDPPIQTADSV